MTQHQLALDADLLHQLFVGNSRDPGVARLLESVLNQVLQVQAQEQLAAVPYERTEDRDDQRHASYTRTLTTRAGTLHLHVPRLRNGRLSTDLFLRYQRSEQALVLALMEMVIQGLSTRKVIESEFSKSMVSHLYRRLDPMVTTWNGRSLAGGRYPFAVADALVVKVRGEGRVHSRSLFSAQGARSRPAGSVGFSAGGQRI